MKDKRLFIWFITIVLAAGLCSGCIQKETKEEITVQEDVIAYLKDNGISKITIDKIGNYEGKKISLPEVSCNDQEIDQAISEELEMYDKTPKIKKRKIVKKGDFICVDLYIPKTRVTREREMLKVGADFFDKEIEAALPGKKVGKKVKVTSSLGTNQKMKVIVTIQSIHKYIKQELTDNFIKNELGFSSKTEYREHIRENLLSEKKEEIKKEKEEEFLEEILANSRIDATQEEIANFAMEHYVESDKSMATSMGLDFEDYITEIYDLNMDDYYDEMYAKAEKEVYSIVAIGVIADQKGISSKKEETVERYQDIREQVFSVHLY